jgi:hypothetical protein
MSFRRRRFRGFFKAVVYYEYAPTGTLTNLLFVAIAIAANAIAMPVWRSFMERKRLRNTVWSSGHARRMGFRLTPIEEATTEKGVPQKGSGIAMRIP